MITRNTWMLASALLLATACSDDDPDSPAAPNDGSVPDASSPLDSGVDASNIDAAIPDATTPTDAAPVDAGIPALEVLGRWHTNFMYTEEITSTVWGFSNLVEYDNSTRIAYTQDTPSMSAPVGKFNKNVWTPVVNGSFYYCTIEFGQATLADAKASTKVADATNPETSGCGGFGWTKMSPVIELEGTWQSAGATFTIDSDNFGTYTVVSYDNAGDKGVLSTGGGDAGPASFSKLVWTVPPVAGRAYYCIVATGLATAADAEASAATADVSQPLTGCNGAAWSSLTK